MKILLVVLLLLAGVAYAQDTPAPVRIRRVVLKLTPLTLISYDPTMQGAIEFVTGKRQSWQGEFGYNRLYSTQTNADATFGQREFWRARTEYRWYQRPPRPYSRGGATGRITGIAPAGSYWAADAYFKQINVVDQRTVTHTCPGGGPCTYSEKLQAPVSRFVGAVYAKYGYQVPFPATDGLPSRFLMDVSAGLGLRRIEVVRYRNDTPADLYYHPVEQIIGNRFDRAFNMVIPDITVSIKIGYAL